MSVNSVFRSLACVLLTLFFVLEFTSPASARKVVFFSWGGETIIKVADFPDAPSFQTSDGHYFDAGAIYKQVQIFFLPLWSYDVRWAGYIDEESYVELNKSELNGLALLASITLPPEIELPFWDRWGGKLVLALLLAVIVLWTVLKVRSDEDPRTEEYEIDQHNLDESVAYGAGPKSTASNRTDSPVSERAIATGSAGTWAMLYEHHGDILVSEAGNGYVFVIGWDSNFENEIWELDQFGKIVRFGMVRHDGEDVIIEFEGETAERYSAHDPISLMSTGYRHTAFRVTDNLILENKPVVLPWMAPHWEHFVFFDDGTAVATSARGNMTKRAGWRWTCGHLQVWVDPADVTARFWTDVVDMLGLEYPQRWTAWHSDSKRARPK